MKEHTPGPWEWIKCGDRIQLSTPNRGRLIVMDFVRKGMNGAQPRFAEWKGEARERLGGIMRPLDEMNLPERHPDAALIAAAPDLLEALRNLAETVELVDPGVYRDCVDQAHEAIKKATPSMSADDTTLAESSQDAVAKNSEINSVSEPRK